VRAAEMSTAIRCLLTGDSRRETEMADPLTSNPEPWSPRICLFRHWLWSVRDSSPSVPWPTSTDERALVRGLAPPSGCGAPSRGGLSTPWHSACPLKPVRKIRTIRKNQILAASGSGRRGFCEFCEFCDRLSDYFRRLSSDRYHVARCPVGASHGGSPGAGPREGWRSRGRFAPWSLASVTFGLFSELCPRNPRNSQNRVPTAGNPCLREFREFCEFRGTVLKHTLDFDDPQPGQSVTVTAASARSEDDREGPMRGRTASRWLIHQGAPVGSLAVVATAKTRWWAQCMQ
jgi:hypothetical protein